MDPQSLPAALLLVAGLAIGLLIAFAYHLWWRWRHGGAMRRDAVQRSQAVTTGKVFEQLVPFFPQFPFDPKDARFLGSPVDLVVFDGLSRGELQRVVFVEVKTGGASLSGRERQVRDAVQGGRVEWSELRVAAEP